jgi:CubicO group peptidase (beta-lactamase class C family)
LKIADFNWEIYKQDGYPSMAGSLWLKPRDMAKIGLMVLNEGQFNGRQIVSKEWICESTSKKIKTHIQGDDYAYQWWNINLKSNGKTYQCIWANGLGSQFIYIIPELKVVIVTTGHNYENDSWAIKSGIEKSLYLLE